MNDTMNKRDGGEEINLMDLLMTYARRWKLLVFCAILIGALALGWTMRFVTPMYRTSLTVYVSNSAIPQDKEHLTSSDLSAALHLVKGYLVVYKNQSVLEKVAEELDGKYTTGQLSGALFAEREGETEFFKLTVTWSDPEEAAAIANAWAKVAPQEMSKGALQGSSAEVYESEAQVPSGPFTPNYTRNTMLGAVVGLVLGAIYVTVMHLRDTRIKNEEELTELFDIPILGRIPDFANEESFHKYADQSE